MMRVILKPAGLACLIGAFGLLTAASLWRYQTARNAGPKSVAAPAAPARADAPPPPAADTPADVPAPVKRALPPGVLLLPDIGSPEWRFLNTAGKASSVMVDSPIPGHPRARRITVEAVGTNSWDVQIARPLEVAFKKGQRVRLTYWAHSKDSCQLAATVEQSAAPYTKIVYRQEQLTPEWKQFQQEWEQGEDTPPGWAKVDFQIGYKVGEIEVTGVVIRLAE